MNCMVQFMGMICMIFCNVYGLIENGYMFIVCDMVVLGCYFVYDFFQYYNIFFCCSIDVGMCEVYNINCCFFDVYLGVDGIKIGFINVVGYNFVVLVQCGNVWIIVVVMGGILIVVCNCCVGELLDMGFVCVLLNMWIVCLILFVYLFGDFVVLNGVFGGVGCMICVNGLIMMLFRL